MSQAFHHLVSLLRPRGTLLPEQKHEIEKVQERSAVLAVYLEKATKNQDDPFGDFARRAREARWTPR